MRGGTPFCRETKGRERAAREGQDHIWPGESPQTETERNPISNCRAFFGLGPALCLHTWGGGEPALGAVLGQRLSPQLEKVVPSLEGCEIVQNLPASGIPTRSGWTEGSVCRRIRLLFPWSAVGKDKACLGLPPRGLPARAEALSPQ